VTPSRSVRRRFVRRRFVRRWTPVPQTRPGLRVSIELKQMNGDLMTFSILAMPGFEQAAMLRGYIQDDKGVHVVTLPVTIKARFA
jgi:hypothetical protein